MPGGPDKITADRGRTFSTLWNLWPYMWPADRPDLKLRVIVVAFGALVAAKIITMLVPYTYKWVTDALTGHGGPPSMACRSSSPGRWRWSLANGVGRFTTTGFNQIRDALFATVGQHAVRQLAYRTFVHCTICRSAITSSGAPAACRASSSAAPTASRPSSASPSSTLRRRSSSSR